MADCIGSHDLDRKRRNL
ncbi:hypothetical protein SOVF_209720, partial [Spinacia oleracea]